MTLKEWIDREGLKQGPAAERLGIDQATLSRILSGQKIGSRETLRLIAERTAGDVTPNDIVLGQAAA